MRFAALLSPGYAADRGCRLPAYLSCCHIVSAVTDFTALYAAFILIAHKLLRLRQIG